MYAVVEDRTKQLRVQQGDEVLCDYRDGAEPGETLTFERVLLISSEGETSLGKPYVEGAKVEAEVLKPRELGTKLRSIRFKRRKNVHSVRGHRQKYTRVRITKIQG